MNDISNVNENNLSTYRIVSIETVGDFIFVETTDESFLIDKKRIVYSIGKCSYVDKIHYMGDDILAVLSRNGKQELVDIKTKEVVVSKKMSIAQLSLKWMMTMLV